MSKEDFNFEKELAALKDPNFTFEHFKEDAYMYDRYRGRSEQELQKAYIFMQKTFEMSKDLNLEDDLYHEILDHIVSPY